MLTSTARAFHQVRWLLLVVGGLYIACVSCGMLISYHRAGAADIRANDTRGAEKYLALERMFGRFREPVRQGSLGAILAVAAIVFLLNLTGSLLAHALPAVFLLPVLTLLQWGWIQGLSVFSSRASCWQAYAFFGLVVALEYAAYVIASVAGLNVGLSVLFPSLQAQASRRKAFLCSVRNGLRLYLGITAILLVQAIVETLYVQKVLLMGGTAIPLGPY